MSDTDVLLPVYHKNASNIRKMFESKKYCMLRIPFYKLGWVTICLSFFSFVFCVFWSILYNFEEANATHCSVENFLPSLSAAIGHFYPQTYVWSLSTLIQMIPRLKISTMYLHYYNAVILDKFSNLFHLAWMCHNCELWCLLGLSLVTSTANYPFHAFCFTCFLFSSMLYMVLSCYLLKFRRKIPPGNVESKTLKWKFKCCLFNIFCFLMAGYFFRRHNMYCEPRGNERQSPYGTAVLTLFLYCFYWKEVLHSYSSMLLSLLDERVLDSHQKFLFSVYSLFAFFEYGVVLSNMLFHLFSIWDFHDKKVTVALTSRGVEVSYSPPFKSIQNESDRINLLIVVMIIILIIFTSNVGSL